MWMATATARSRDIERTRSSQGTQPSPPTLQIERQPFKAAFLRTQVEDVLQNLHVLRLQTLGTLYDAEGNRLTFL